MAGVINITARMAETIRKGNWRADSSLAYARRAMASLTEKNQLDPLNTYFGPQPRVAVAAGVAYHSYNHYGQLVVYARMNGIVPPASQR